MSFHHSPKIVTNGLVFHVDPSNPRCYSGGSVCTDLTNINGNATITNVSLSSDKAFLMNATTSSISFVKKINLASNFTYSVVFYVNVLTPNDGLCLLSSFNNNYGGIGLAVYDATIVQGIWDAFSDNLATGDELYANFDGSSNTFSKKIRILTGTYNGSTIAFYLNGNKIDSRVSPATIPEQTYIDIGFAHGAFWTNNVTAAGTKIYQASVYNRALTDSEILQNYNAFKGRFKL